MRQKSPFAHQGCGQTSLEIFIAPSLSQDTFILSNHRPEHQLLLRTVFMGLLDRFTSPSKDNHGWDESIQRQHLNNQMLRLPVAVQNFGLSWSSPQLVTLSACSLAAFGLGVGLGRKVSSMITFPRITSAHMLQDHQIGPQSSYLKGRVVNVTDGDTFRFYHQPTWFHSSTPKSDTKLSDQTIAIRVCTIDTPEVAKFGKPSQPFGDDAKALLQQHLLPCTYLQVQILQRDQYGRAVASVSKQSVFGRTYMDEVMLKAGLAEVYQGGGAVYGPKGKDYYLKLEETARSNKTGMWSQTNRESAAEFKMRTKEEQ
jgi:endonuclease YncB( thermonuclease family)